MDYFTISRALTSYLTPELLEIVAEFVIGTGIGTGTATGREAGGGKLELDVLSWVYCFFGGDSILLFPMFGTAFGW